MKNEDRALEIKKYFEDTGYISCHYLMRKYKVTWQEASKLLKPLKKGCIIVDEHDGHIIRLVKEYCIEDLKAKLLD